ncbi:hypothetical protein STEG23_028869, partial [Scotinomys teguina]
IKMESEKSERLEKGTSPSSYLPYQVLCGGQCQKNPAGKVLSLLRKEEICIPWKRILGLLDPKSHSDCLDEGFTLARALSDNSRKLLT